MNSHFSTVTSAILLATAAGLAFAGPLNPPSGGVTSTMKTLTEIEPRIAINLVNTPGDVDSLFRISQPGSYYLTGNVTGVIGKHGIEIAASGVTIDLNGFELAGEPGLGSYDGVNVSVSNLTHLAIRNGSVRNWGGDGIDLGTTPTIGSRISDICSSGNSGFGVKAGHASTVTACTASSNAAGGIGTARACTVSNCSAYSNGVHGISVGNCCVVTACTATLNASDGIRADVGSTITACSTVNNLGNGIECRGGGTISNCTTRDNALDGILCTHSSLIRDNTCSSNGIGNGDGAGIHITFSGNRIEGNNCSGADRGIDVDYADNFIVRNTCTGNTINWVIAANNVCGPIINRISAGSAAISGDSAPDSTLSTHPEANFTY